MSGRLLFRADRLAENLGNLLLLRRRDAGEEG
jgi:hypothetical protein